ncbi:MAG TPA: RDD family protein [Acidimicrobiia bacterium]
MTAATSSPIRNATARGLQGKRAGIASRVTADAIDWGIVVLIYVGILVCVALADYLVGSGSFHVPRPPAGVTLGSEWVIAVLYLTAGWTGTNRTIGKSVMGLRVVTNRGQLLRPRRSFLRALICATLGAIALAWVIVSRRRAGIHDIAVRTSVVYDWTTAT